MAIAALTSEKRGEKMKDINEKIMTIKLNVDFDKEEAEKKLERIKKLVEELNEELKTFPQPIVTTEK